MSPYALTMATDDIVHRVLNRAAGCVVSTRGSVGRTSVSVMVIPGGQTITGVWGLGASAP
jgi:hypothetical protein